MIQLLLKLEDRNIFSFFSPGVRSSIQKKKEKGEKGEKKYTKTLQIENEIARNKHRNSGNIN